MRDRLLQWWEDDLYPASELMGESSWLELFDRYIKQVSGWSTAEKT